MLRVVLEPVERRGELRVQAVDHDAEVRGDLLEVGDHHPVELVGDPFAEARVGGERHRQGHVGLTDRDGQHRVVGLADRHEARHAQPRRLGDVGRGVDRVGERNGRALGDLERDHREGHRGPREPVDHELGRRPDDRLAVSPPRDRQVPRVLRRSEAQVPPTRRRPRADTAARGHITTAVTLPAGLATPRGARDDSWREKELAGLLAAITLLLVGAHAFGYLFAQFRQPRVIGEILGGLVLGPTVLGALAPGVQAALFPSTGPIPLVLDALYQLGLLLLMFGAGAEVRVSFDSKDDERWER